jgi:hypothetical protein
MSGGGGVDTSSGRIHHNISLKCDVNQWPQTLDVHWRGNRFELTTLTSIVCYDDPSIPNPPNASFDTIFGTGTGTYNGEPATIEFRFTDAGEPGSNDRAQYTIRNSSGGVIVSVNDTLDQGNQQAHGGSCPGPTPTGTPGRRAVGRMELYVKLQRMQWAQR